MTTSPDYFDMKAAPMRIGTVHLKVRDLDAVWGYYQRVLGLTPLDEGESSVVLGGRTPLLHLAGDPALTPRDPRQVGLFHTAFLMPSRADLARWLAFVTEAGVPLQGASDHVVSEAIYLADPEGNGIEIYADRPTDRWRDGSGEIRMTTEPLDVQDLLAAAGGTSWAGFPEQGSIGHVHLQVGDTEAADRFYRDVLGFDIAARYPGASFFGSGGYHHQLAGNVWNSRRAGRRPEGMAGLDRVEIVVSDATEISNIVMRTKSAGTANTQSRDATILRDPWGTVVRLSARATADFLA
jgi:catechol 2,3-dioxygenase